MSFDNEVSPFQLYDPISFEAFMGIPAQYGMLQEQAEAFKSGLETTHRLYSIDTGGGINLARLISTKGAEACLMLDFTNKFMLMAQVRSSEEGGYVHMSEPVDVSNRYHQENGLLRWTYKEFLNKGERL